MFPDHGSQDTEPWSETPRNYKTWNFYNREVKYSLLKAVTIPEASYNYGQELQNASPTPTTSFFKAGWALGVPQK